MILVFAVIVAVVFLFIVEWVRVDVVAILAMIALPALGLIDGRTAFAGFGSTAVVSIIAVIILGRGLDHTGVIAMGVRPLLRLAGCSRWRIVALLSLTIAIVSSFMQNIGAAALFLPALRRISRESGLPLSQLLMPVGAAAILGGTITLVGSSPLIMLNDLLAPDGLEPFGLFSVTPVGLALVGAGILFFIITGPLLLPGDRQSAGTCELPNDPSLYYKQLGELYELTFPQGGNKAFKVYELCDNYLVHTVALASLDGSTKLIPPDRDSTVEPGSVIAVYGPREKVDQAAARFGFQVSEQLNVFAQDLDSEMAGIAEAVVPPHSIFVGKTLREIRFRHNYLVAPLALYREENDFYTQLGGHELKVGDAVLMHGAWRNFKRFRQTRDLIFSQSMDREILHPQKAGMAIACFALATGLVIFSNLSLPVCLMAGAIGMVLTGVLSIDEAYQGVDWRTVFLLAGLIPLGLATQETGAAAWAAGQLMEWLHQPPTLVVLLILAIMSTLFTLVVSNVGAVVLLVPLVINLAEDLGVDPRLAALVVGLAASNSFILPTHQVNALYMGPGGYRSLDFIKTGVPLSIIFVLVLTTMVYFFY
ncbi:MAG: SLC13 family permease [Deltaproteobacteria bacterium]|nr:SLC13 family permease [Deltaproteobacteria bacterium]